jgi:sporulation protein YlmC with PRC-barrel domain
VLKRALLKSKNAQTGRVRNKGSDLPIKVKEMNGKKVITIDAYNLGEIDGAHVDINIWKITDLNVKLTKESIKELQLKKPKLGSLSVCLPVTDVKQFGDVVVLKYTLKTFKNLKACKT